MLLKDKLHKYKNQPLTMIVKGANALGIELAKSLLEQEGLVIMVDEYTADNENLLNDLIKNDYFAFLDVSGIDSMVTELSRLDYVIFFNNDIYLDQESSVSSQEFLGRSKLLDTVLELSIRNNSKFLLTTSIKAHQLLLAKRDISHDVSISDDTLSYTNLEIQRYAESLTWEYMKRSNLDGRMLRLAEVIGEGIDMNEDSAFINFIKNSVQGEKITIIGDGLERQYYIHIVDAAYGIIKALFSKDAKGKIYSVYLEDDITVLSLAYKIQDLVPNAKSIEFKDGKESSELNVYKPAKNLTEIGWKAKIPFERALAQTIDYYYDCINSKTKPSAKSKVKSDAVIDKKKIEPDQEIQDNTPKKRNLKDILVDFFFETEEVKPKPSALDNLIGSSEMNLKPNPERKSTFQNIPKSSKHVRSVPLGDRLMWQLSNLTFSKIAWMLLYFAIFLVVYLYFILPVTKVTVNGVLFYKDIHDINNSNNSGNYEFVGSKVSSASKNISIVDDNLKEISWITDLVLSESQSERLNLTTSQYRQVLSDINTIYDDSQKINEYYDQIKINMSLDSSGILIADQANSSLNMDVDPAYLSANILNMKTTANNLTKLNLKLGILNDKHDEINSTLLLLSAQMESINSTYPAMREALGYSNPTSYVIFYQDQNQQNPLGGIMSSYFFITVDKGKFSIIKSGNPSNVPLTLDANSKSRISTDLESMYNIKKDPGTLTINDVAMLGDVNLFSDLVQKSYSQNGITPTNVVLVRQSAFGTYSSRHSEFTYSGSSVALKDLSVILDKLVRDLENNPKLFFDTVYDMMSNEDIAVYSNSKAISKDIFENEFSLDQYFIEDSSSILTFVADNSSSKDVSVSVNHEASLKSDNVMENNRQYVVENNGSNVFNGYLYIKLPQIESISETPNKRSGNILIYPLSLEANEKDVFSVNTTAKNALNYRLELVNVIGLDYNYDYTIKFPLDFKVTKHSDFLQKNADSLFWKSKVDKDTDLMINFSK